MHSIFIENECTLREQLYYLNVKTRMHWHDIGKYELQKKKLVLSYTSFILILSVLHCFCRLLDFNLSILKANKNTVS